MSYHSLIGIDRDGVIFDVPPDVYITSVEQVVFIEDAIHALVDLQKSGYFPVVITNQSMMGNGSLSVATYKQICDKLQDRLKACKGYSVGILTCPHDKNERCGCRKPEVGLLYYAEGLYYPLTMSWFIGDYYTDIVAGTKKRCKTILVETGRGLLDANYQFFDKYKKYRPTYICRDLCLAVELILRSKL